jgi:hypothetical protein
MLAKRKPLPSVGDLKRLLRFDEATGRLFYTETGREAFRVVSNGYRQGCVLGEKYSAHRIVWKLMTGEEPDQIDHIDGDRLNNRFENLRNVSASENQRNKKLGRNNKSGISGIHFEKQTRKWDAVIYVNRKRIRLGRFANLSDAISARKMAESRYGFHVNHGRAL